MPAESNHILVVDDEPAVLGMLGNFFRSIPYAVTAKTDAESAIEHMKSEAVVDLLVTDFGLPGRDGIELLQISRQIRPDLPVIIITGHKKLELAVSALQNGANDFLTKPLDLHEVRKVVDKVLRHRRTSRDREQVVTWANSMNINFEIPTSRIDEDVVADYLAQFLLQAGFCDTADYQQYKMAFSETLVNAIEHGNLELQSLRKGSDFSGDAAFADERRRRLADPAFGKRMVRVAFLYSRERFSLTVSDEGPGFDWRAYSTVNNSLQDVNDRPFGRGFLFIRLIIDEILFNDAGNSITLIKTRRTG